MKTFLSVLLLTLLSGTVTAQPKVLLALPIVAVPETAAGDVYLKISRPPGIIFNMFQTFLCKGVYKSSDADTATKGSGIITGITDTYLEARIKSSDMDAMPDSGDICFFMVKGTAGRKDVFYKLARNAIGFTEVTDNVLFEPKDNLGNWNEAQTKALLTKLKDDIIYTGKEMLAQQNNQQMKIEGGDYNGKLLFSAMQEITEKDVLEFLKYVWARPTKYTGHNWKISEVFATWMTNKTPKFTGHIE